MRRVFLVAICILLLCVPACASEGQFWAVLNNTPRAIPPIYYESPGTSPIVVGDRIIAIVLNSNLDQNATVYSDDGSTWHIGNASPAYPIRARPATAYYDGKMWLSGGYLVLSNLSSSKTHSLNDTWWTTDGNIWHLANSSAEFPARYGHSMISYDNKLWIFGGLTKASGGTYFNDTWWTTDGEIWYRANSSAEFPKRMYAASIVYDNKMWIMSGSAGASQFNDTWWSYNGSEWYSTARKSPWEAGSDYHTFTYNGYLYIIGSANSKFQIWRTTDVTSWELVNESGSPFLPAGSGRYFCYGLFTYKGSVYTLGGNFGNGTVQFQTFMCGPTHCSQLADCSTDITPDVATGIQDIIVIGLVIIVGVILATGISKIMTSD